MVKASSPTVKAIFVLDSDGNRVCAKYYDKSYPTQKEQMTLEKKLFAKTKNSTARLEADIILIENIVSVYRCGSDTTMHVIGPASENELILLTVLNSAFDAICNLLKGRMDRHVMLDNIELVLLTFDEVVDGGIILEVDTPSISNRVLMRGIDNEVPMAELTISQLESADGNGEPIVEIHDNSRNSMWVNADRLGKGASTRLASGFTVHFTKPGATPAGVLPMVYKFEFLNSHGPSPVCSTNEAIEVPKDAEMTVVADESIDATQLTSPISQPERKRKRTYEESPIVSESTQVQGKEQVAAESFLEIVANKPKNDDAQGSDENGLECTFEDQVDKLKKDNLELVAKLEIARAEIVQLQRDVAVKDNDMEVKITEATAKNLEEIMKLKEETLAKEKDMEFRIKETHTKSIEAEMAVRLKDATKKYQQKLEAEHYEQRKEMSEKLAAFANENESLKVLSDKKNDELNECRDEITRLREKISRLEDVMSSRENILTETTEKVNSLEEKLAVSKDECAKMCELLAAAVTAAENEAPTAAHADTDKVIGVGEQLEQQKSSYSPGKDIKTHPAQNANTASEGSTTSTFDERSTGPDDNAQALRARLATAFRLFTEIQALSLQGTNLITGSNRPEQGDEFPLLTAEKLTRANTPAKDLVSSSSPQEELHNCCNNEDMTDLAKNSVNGVAEPKESSSTLHHEKKTDKEAALGSRVIETDAVLTVASVKTSSTCSPSDSSTTVAKGDVGDWEMLE